MSVSSDGHSAFAKWSDCSFKVERRSSYQFLAYIQGCEGDATILPGAQTDFISQLEPWQTVAFPNWQKCIFLRL